MLTIISVQGEVLKELHHVDVQAIQTVRRLRKQLEAAKDGDVRFQLVHGEEILEDSQRLSGLGPSSSDVVLQAIVSHRFYSPVESFDGIRAPTPLVEQEVEKADVADYVRVLCVHSGRRRKTLVEIPFVLCLSESEEFVTVNCDEILRALKKRLKTNGRVLPNGVVGNGKKHHMLQLLCDFRREVADFLVEAGLVSRSRVLTIPPLSPHACSRNSTESPAS